MANILINTPLWEYKQPFRHRALLVIVGMEKIIENYYLAEGSKLVMHVIGTNGVDCWFDTSNVRQHRCLSFEDFELIKGA